MAENKMFINVSDVHNLQNTLTSRKENVVSNYDEIIRTMTDLVQGGQIKGEFVINGISSVIEPLNKNKTDIDKYLEGFINYLKRLHERRSELDRKQAKGLSDKGSDIKAKDLGKKSSGGSGGSPMMGGSRPNMGGVSPMMGGFRPNRPNDNNGFGNSKPNFQSTNRDNFRPNPSFEPRSTNNKMSEFSKTSSSGSSSGSTGTSAGGNFSKPADSVYDRLSDRLLGKSLDDSSSSLATGESAASKNLNTIDEGIPSSDFTSTKDIGTLDTMDVLTNPDTIVSSEELTGAGQSNNTSLKAAGVGGILLGSGALAAGIAKRKKESELSYNDEDDMNKYFANDDNELSELDNLDADFNF